MPNPATDSLGQQIDAVAYPSEKEPQKQQESPLSLDEQINAVASPTSHENSYNDVNPKYIEESSLSVGGQFALPYLASADPENLTKDQSDAVDTLQGSDLLKLKEQNPRYKFSVKQYRDMREAEKAAPSMGAWDMAGAAIGGVARMFWEGVKGSAQVGSDLLSSGSNQPSIPVGKGEIPDKSNPGKTWNPQYEPDSLGASKIEKPWYAGENWTPSDETPEASRKRALSNLQAPGNAVAGIPLAAYQASTKIQQGGVQALDDLGFTVDASNGPLTIRPLPEGEKLVRYITRHEIDADRARVAAKAPTSVGQLLYYLGEKPSDTETNPSPAQLWRPLLASILVDSPQTRMAKNPGMTRDQANDEFAKESDSWGTDGLQHMASILKPASPEVQSALQLAAPEMSPFGVAAGALGKASNLIAKGRENAIIRESADQLRPKMPGATEAEIYDAAAQSHADFLKAQKAAEGVKAGQPYFNVGPWEIPKPYTWASALNRGVNATGEWAGGWKTALGAGAGVATAGGVIGAYNTPGGLREKLRGFEEGAALSGLGGGALWAGAKAIGAGAGVLGDLGRTSVGLAGQEGNAFKIAGDLESSTKATQKIFGGKMGKITTPTANFLAKNMAHWAYEGVQAGTLATAMGIADSVPTKDLPEQAAQGIAMAMTHSIIGSAMSESPGSRESRIKQENASINEAKRSASPETQETASIFSDYRGYVNLKKQGVKDAIAAHDAILKDPKSKPADVYKSQNAIKEAQDNLAEAQTANVATRMEYGRQFDLAWALVHKSLNGPLRAGQKNAGVEILTNEQIYKKLVESNPLIAIPDGDPRARSNQNDILWRYANEAGAVYDANGTVHLKAGSDIEQALEASQRTIRFDPLKTTAVINASDVLNNGIFTGKAPIETLLHEPGHILPLIPEWRAAFAPTMEGLFDKTFVNDQGEREIMDHGEFSDDHLRELMFDTYVGRNKSKDEKIDWLARRGLWDDAKKEINQKGVAYMQHEVIADMNANILKGKLAEADSGAGWALKWASYKYQNTLLARAVQRVTGLGGDDPTSPAYVTGAVFSPEIAKASREAFQALESYHGVTSPLIRDETPFTFTPKDLHKSKPLIKKYGLTTGLYQTEVTGTIYDKEGNIVAKAKIANPMASDGEWKTDLDTKLPVQVAGYGQIPDEFNKVVIPEGATLKVQRNVAFHPDQESPIRLSDRAVKDHAKLKSQILATALGIEGEIPEDGFTWRGNLDENQIARIKALPEHIVPFKIKDALIKFNEDIREGKGQRYLINYAPTSGGNGKRKAFSAKIYDVVPIGLHFTKAGNVNVTHISVTRLFAKLHAWESHFPQLMDKYWGGSNVKFFNEFASIYLPNLAKGKIDGNHGAIGLDPDPQIAFEKKEIFNNFLNLKRNDTAAMNSNRFYLPKEKGDRSTEGRDRTIMSMRLDAIASMEKSHATKLPMTYEMAVINLMPARDDYPTSESGMYSQLQKTIDEKMPKNASVEQIRAIIDPTKGSGVKPDEVKWSNLDGFLEGKKNVSKQEVLDYLRNEGSLKFESKVLSNNSSKDVSPNMQKWMDRNSLRPSSPDSWSDAAMYLEKLAQAKQEDGLHDEANDLFDLSSEADMIASGFGSDGSRKSQPPKYSQYVIPGGENYREVVLTMPRQGKPTDEEINRHNSIKRNMRDNPDSVTPDDLHFRDKIHEKIVNWGNNNAATAYVSPHFQETPDYVAHMRLDDRTDAEGKQGTLIEEIQSDRGQGIRKQESNPSGQRIPDMPFAKDWHVQMFKRALMEAISSNHDWIGWTKGETQAERYDLSKSISRIELHPNAHEKGDYLSAYDMNDKRVIDKIIKPEELADYIGKESAQKLNDQEARQTKTENSNGSVVVHSIKTLRGLDLKVGGDGMKGFYDDILPKEASKFVKKFGGKVELSEVPSGDKETTIWKVEITPEMKRVANEGFPQFMPARNESSKDENISKGISAAKEAAKGVAAIRFAQPDKKKKNNNQLTTTKELENNEESN